MMNPTIQALLPLLFLLALCYGLSRQARRPRGWVGRRLIGAALNRGNRRLLESAVEALEARAGDRVADIGFGGGFALDLLRTQVAPARPAGVEISTAMIEAGRERWGDAVVLHLADVATLPFADGSLDGLLSVNTIYFWPDPAAAFREIRRVLRPGGRFVLGIRRPGTMRLSPITWFGFKLRPPAHIERLLNAAGFFVAVHEKQRGEVLFVAQAGTDGTGREAVGRV